MCSHMFRNLPYTVYANMYYEVCLSIFCLLKTKKKIRKNKNLWCDHTMCWLIIVIRAVNSVCVTIMWTKHKSLFSIPVDAMSAWRSTNRKNIFFTSIYQFFVWWFFSVVQISSVGGRSAECTVLTSCPIEVTKEICLLQLWLSIPL